MTPGATPDNPWVGTRSEGSKNDPGGCIVPLESCHQPTGDWE